MTFMLLKFEECQLKEIRTSNKINYTVFLRCLFIFQCHNLTFFLRFRPFSEMSAILDIIRSSCSHSNNCKKKNVPAWRAHSHRTLLALDFLYTFR